MMRKFMMLVLLVFVMIGCANTTMRSELDFSDPKFLAEKCFPDGTCPVVIRNLNGGIIAGKQMIDTFVTYCRKEKGKIDCFDPKHTGYVGDGLLEHSYKGGVNYQASDGSLNDEYNDSSSTNTNVSGTSGANAGAASSSRSKSSARNRNSNSNRNKNTNRNTNRNRSSGGEGGCRGRCSPN